MNVKDLFKMAVSNLNRHKTRTFLTVLGIVIGTMSIIMMVALGLGMQDSFSETIEDMGSVYIIEVSKGDNVDSSTRLSEVTTSDELTDLDIDFFKSLDYVEAVSPVISTNVKMVSGEYAYSGTLVGLDMDLFGVMKYELAENQEVADNKVGIIFGEDAAEGFSEVELSSATGSAGSGNKMQDFMAAMRNQNMRMREGELPWNGK